MYKIENLTPKEIGKLVQPCLVLEMLTKLYFFRFDGSCGDVDQGPAVIFIYIYYQVSCGTDTNHLI